MPFTHETESVFAGAQLFAETTWGSDGAATLRLGATEMNLSPKLTSNKRTLKGQLLPSVVAVGRQWSELTFDGLAAYPEIGYFVESVSSDVAVVDPNSYTVEIGGQQVCGAIVDKWSVKGNRDEISYSGSMIGKKRTTAAATGSLAVPTLTPFQAPVTTITIATTGYTKAFEWGIDVFGLWNPAFFIGSTDVANIVQRAIEASFSFKVEADTAGLVPLGFNDGSTKAVVVECSHGTTPNDYTLSFTFNAVFEEPDTFSDEDGVYAIGYKAQIVNTTTTAITVVCSKA